MGNLSPHRSERPELTERELAYITLHTTYSRKQIDDFHVRFRSHYPRGYLTREQFCALYSSELAGLTDAQPLLERLFDHIDVDRNNRLNFKEILFFKAITMPKTNCEEKFRWLFLLYDTNHDQQLDRREFLDLCRLAYHIHGRVLTRTREDEFRILFEQFDRNQDEQLNCDEFIRLCHQCPDLLELIAPMFRNTKWKNDAQENNPPPTFTSSEDDLSPEQLRYLLERTKFTREQILRYHQTFKLRCRSGRLSKSEFVDFYQQLLPSFVTSAQTYCEFMFRAFDTISHDGFIQFDEFLIAIYIHSKASSPREKLEWLYNAYDRDGDGTIDYNEINHIVHALFILYGIDREQHSVAYMTYEIMAKLDLNDDDKISKQEFINMLKDKELTNFLAPSFVKQP